MRADKQPIKFFRQVLEDNRLCPFHISLYASLIICCDPTNYGIPFHISRSRLMRISRIRSIATYHKCLKDLIGFGHIIYEPSYQPKKGSQITLLTP